MSAQGHVIIRNRLFWMNKRFAKPGLYIWNGKNNVRIFPWFKGHRL